MHCFRPDETWRLLHNHGRPHYLEAESRLESPSGMNPRTLSRPPQLTTPPQDQPLLRLPFELLRKNFKAAHFHVEKESTAVKSTLRDTANASLNSHASPDDVLKNVDSMLARMRGLKRKLEACAEEEARLQQQSQSRVRHLGELYSMQSLDDVKYERWSRTRLDRLLVDYLLRNGYKDSATALAKEKGINDLVDVETFIQMSRIRESLRNGRVTEALSWCNENKKDLRRMEVCP
jgi:macrophage erythroblast attacher